VAESLRNFRKERIYRQLAVVFGILYGASLYFLLYYFERNSKLRSGYLVVYLGSIAVGLLAGLLSRKRLKQFNIYTSLGVGLFFILIQISTALGDVVPSFDYRLTFFIYLGLAIAATAEIVLVSMIVNRFVPEKQEEQKTIEDDFIILD